MLTILENIANSIIGIIMFAVNTLQSLMLLITKIPTYTAMLIEIISQIPITYQAIITATISLSVIFLITNRGK